MTETLVDGSVVARFTAMQPAGDIPKNLTRKRPARSKSDFDPNTYFTILTHLKVKEGHTLDYVYQYDENFAGEPYLYVRPIDAKPLGSFLEYVGWREKNDLLSYIDIDDTPDAFSQLAVFNRLADQFYLYWHANYKDAILITTPGETDQVIEAVNVYGSCAKLTEEQISGIKALSQTPSVTMEDVFARVTYCDFTKWGGCTRGIDHFMRTPPREFVGRIVVDSVKYDCGICF